LLTNYGGVYEDNVTKIEIRAGRTNHKGPVKERRRGTRLWGWKKEYRSLIQKFYVLTKKKSRLYQRMVAIWYTSRGKGGEGQSRSYEGAKKAS